MLIKFNILWIEDKKRYVDTTGNALRTFLDKLGFYLEIDHIQNPEIDPVDKYLSNTSKYDLILVDWRFQADGDTDKPLGGEIIEKIREKIAFADIIFYSGSPDIEEEFKEKGLQGVYLATRKYLKDEAKELIEHLLYKTLHPKIMRGIIISELSHIDDFCYRIIREKYASSSCDKIKFANAIKDTIKVQARKQYNDKLKAIRKGDKEFIENLHSTIILDSYKRALKIVELAQEDTLDIELLNQIAKLPETVNKRNKLAHWKRSEETDKHITLSQTDKPDYIFDQSEAASIRKNINNAAKALSQYLFILSEKR